MKQLFFLRKNENDLSLHIEQIEQLEFDLLFEKIDQTDTHFGSQYLYYLITQLKCSLPKNRGEVYPNKINSIKKKLSEFNRHRHSTFVNYLLGEKDPFWIVKNLNIKLYSVLALINLISAFLLFLTPLALIPFVLLSFVNSTIYYSHKLSFFYVRDTVLCANDIYNLFQKLEENNIGTPLFKSFKNTSRLIRYLYAEINPFLNELAVVFFMVEALKSIFLIDLFFANVLFQRIEKNKPKLLEYYYLIGEIDAQISISELREKFEHNICTPSFVKSRGCFLNVKKLVNPLIEKFKPIDFELNEGVIITGHNASGKSSLIKSIITNFILGKTIGICFCKEFTTSFDNIHFLIGSSDNTSKHQSLYQYEIEKLEEIVNSTEQKNRNNLILLDEIIRGTNEVDRQQITFSISKYLNEQRNNSVIISTHSISLAKRLMSNSFNSYYFKTSVSKTTGLVKFEYELEEGIEETTNAKALLKKYKFPSAIIENIN